MNRLLAEYENALNGNNADDSTSNMTTEPEITPKYVVTYHIDTNDTQTQEFESGESVITGLSFTPSKDGYTFVGWREDTEANSSILTSKTMESSAINLYAVFRKTITLSYDTKGGTPIPSPQTDYQYYNNENVVNPTFVINAEDPTRSGYNFKGWFMDDVKYEEEVSDILILSDDTTIFAKWASKGSSVVPSVP